MAKQGTKVSQGVLFILKLLYLHGSWFGEVKIRVVWSLSNCWDFEAVWLT